MTAFPRSWSGREFHDGITDVDSHATFDTAADSLLSFARHYGRFFSRRMVPPELATMPRITPSASVYNARERVLRI